MAAPAFVSKGTAAAATAASVAPTFPASIAAGDILLVLALTKDNVEINVPSGFSQDATNAARNQSAALRAEWFWKRAAGTETGTLTVDKVSGTTLLFAQIYRFTGGIATGDPYEAAAMTGVGSGTVTPTDITTLGDERLMVALLAIEDDNPTPGDYTGGTATVTEAAEDGTATGTDGKLHVATVARSVAETFDYGTMALGLNREHIVFSFALKPADSYIPRYSAHDFGSVTI